MRIYMFLLLWIITNLTGDGWLLFWAVMLDGVVSLVRYSYTVYKQQEATKELESAMGKLFSIGEDDDQ